MPAEPAVYEPMLPLAAVAGDGAWSPHFDVRELPDGYIGLADLPGVQPGAIAVTACPHQRRSELRRPGGGKRLERKKLRVPEVDLARTRGGALEATPSSKPESRGLAWFVGHAAARLVRLRMLGADETHAFS